MEELLLETLKNLITSATAAANFTAEQLPDVVQQLLIYKAVSSVMTQLIAFLVLYFVGIRSIQYAFDDNANDDFTIPAFLVGGIVCILSLLVIFLNTGWLQIWLAPKVYLIEYAARLIK